MSRTYALHSSPAQNIALTGSATKKIYQAHTTQTAKKYLLQLQQKEKRLQTELARTKANAHIAIRYKNLFQHIHRKIETYAELDMQHQALSKSFDSLIFALHHNQLHQAIKDCNQLQTLVVGFDKLDQRNTLDEGEHPEPHEAHVEAPETDHIGHHETDIDGPEQYEGSSTEHETHYKQHQQGPSVTQHEPEPEHKPEPESVHHENIPGRHSSHRSLWDTKW